MFNLENSIKKWLKSFRKHRAFDHGSIREMELHLRDHIEDLIADGNNEKEAFELAVAEFGQIPAMAEEEFWNLKKKTTFTSIIHTAMPSNYFKTWLRSLMKNPLSSFINIFGLSIAIGICTLVYAFIEQDIKTDGFHKNKNEVYLTTFFADRDGTNQQDGRTPTPLGEMLREDFTHIKKVCRIEDDNVVLKYKEKVFHERVRYVDAEFLEMFTFPLKWGLSSSLTEMNSIILSEEMSIKYFGEENPIGQDILMIYGENRSKPFTITGVAEAFPKAHAIDFNFLINFENLRITNPSYDLTDWNGFVNATLIQVEDPSDVKVIEQEMEKYRILQNAKENDWAISSFAFVQLAQLHEKSRDIRNDISYGTREEGWIFLSIMAIFMLALACFNYINIAIVSAAKRLKEIGVRKVMGANRGQVVFQFLTENIFVAFFALVLGLIMAATIFIPGFNQLFHRNMEIRLLDENLWIFFISILLFTGVASGIYPAFYISKFAVVKIFKGSMQFGKKNPLTKILLCFQLILACITISGGVLFTQNNTYQVNRSWGYNPNETLYMNIPDNTAFKQLNAVMTQNPNVLSVSGSRHHLGKSWATTMIRMPDRLYEAHQLSVDANYFETMRLQPIAGRVFKDRSEGDKRTVVVNEVLVNKMALVEPLGQVFEIDSVKYEIIGVVKDFHISDFDTPILPTIFKVADQRNYRYLSLRVGSGTEKETYEALQAEWSESFPEIPFQGGHQVDVFDSYFEYLDSGTKFWKTIAFIAILLASLGLYGLVTLNVSGRVREFSVKKAMGASINNIAGNITKQYLILTAVALTIGAPLSYIAIEAIFNTFFEYRMPMNYSGIALAAVILIVVLFAVISTQIRKVSKSNPVDGLKVE